MNKNDFFFELPPNLIAQTPIKNRSGSKLLALNKKTGEIKHLYFNDILNFLNRGDCLVINNTRVIPARLIGQKKQSVSKIEFLLLKRIDGNIWETLVKPGKKVKIGDEIVFGNGLLNAKVLEIIEDGKRKIEFSFEGVFEEILDELGQMPLPPYITAKLEDKNRYQTVYAKVDGSVAAPTAGLHFTEELLESIKEKNIRIANVTLHVGLGTFRPVKVENILNHKMHSEYFVIEEDQAKIINETKKNGGKVIAVGTTSCRTLESCCNFEGFIESGVGQTDIFIYPGYQFKIVDNLITNFHLPESTLIMLVSALAGKEKIFAAYNEAIFMNYRFFSFGDAMYIFE